MKVDRLTLLRSLEAVMPGVATKEAIEQSSCFVFMDGKVLTFNDEVSCSMDCPLGITGAVGAAPMLALFQKLAEETLDVSIGDNTLRIKGKGRRSSFIMDEEITLPVAHVEKPDEWEELDPEFAEAINVVSHCAGNDPNSFHLMCVNITEDFVEACDNFQIARYPLDTPLDRPIQIKASSAKHVAGLGMTEMCITESWIHFKNKAGLVVSIRLEMVEYDDYEGILATEGDLTTLPKGLPEAVEKAEIFSSQDSENNTITVKLAPGKLILRGKGGSGWHEELKKVKYKGAALEFAIAPKLLIDITQRSNDCYVSPGKLRIDGGKFTYVTCLGTV